MFFLSLATLGVVELAFLALFFIACVVGVTFDRRGVEEPKWAIIGVGAALIAVWYWSHWTFFGAAHIPAEMNNGTVVHEAVDRIVLWSVIQSWDLWRPVSEFLIAGLVYSLVEFALDVRRTARFYATEWTKYLTHTEEIEVTTTDADGNVVYVTEEVRNGRGERVTKNVTRQREHSEVYAEVKAKGAASNLFNKALKLSQEFISQYRFKNRFIELTLNKDTKIDVEPKINKVELAEHITAWTLMWPMYLVSLVLGDLLVEIGRVLADVLVKISGRFVRLSFANVFKF